jgi:hypothetical protein
MAASPRKLIRVLSAELEDLLDDIGHDEKRGEERFSCNEITEYVYRGNESVLKHEEDAIKVILDFIDEMDISLYKSTAELAAALESQIGEIVREHEDPDAVYQYFLKKLRKAERYIASDD